jgi:hypothetical protein
MKKNSKTSPQYITINPKHLKITGLFSLFLGAFVFAVFVTNVLQGSVRGVDENHKKSEIPVVEIEQIKKAPDTYRKSKIYQRLIERVGPEEAQDLLAKSGLPYNGNTHLLNHTVGDFLYKKYGPSGIVHCRDYFSSSCYHGVIINSLGDGKLENVKIMMDACRKKGESILGQCVHGLGHGFLPYVGYANLLDALSLCDEVGKDIKGFNFYLCHNGVFMENIWGVHDGKPSPDRWVKENEDILYPCNDPRIDSKYLGACWYNQHTIMEKYYDGDIKKVGNECYQLSDASYQKECFEGLFNVMQAAAQGNVDKQFEDCRKMPKDWFVQCLTTQIIVELSHGGNSSSFEICARIDKKDKETCYDTLIDVMFYYSQPPQHEELCKKIPKEHRIGKCGKFV